jgi:hypothetical protein
MWSRSASTLDASAAEQPSATAAAALNDKKFRQTNLATATSYSD